MCTGLPSPPPPQPFRGQCNRQIVGCRTFRQISFRLMDPFIWAVSPLHLLLLLLLLFHISYPEHKHSSGCGARSTSLCVHRNLFCQLSTDGNLHGSGMSHAMTASPNPFFRAPWRVGDAMVGRGNVGWTTSKSEQPFSMPELLTLASCRKTGRGSLLNHLSYPCNDPTGQGTEPSGTS